VFSDVIFPANYFYPERACYVAISVAFLDASSFDDAVSARSASILSLRAHTWQRKWRLRRNGGA